MRRLRRFLLLFLVLHSVLFPCFGQTIEQDLEQQIQSLIGIAESVRTYNEQMSSLREKLLNLEEELKISKEDSEKLMIQYEESTKSLKDYQGKVQILMDNYSGLLTLSRQSRQGLENWRTAFLISTSMAAVSLLILLIVLTSKQLQER